MSIPAQPDSVSLADIVQWIQEGRPQEEIVRRVPDRRVSARALLADLSRLTRQGVGDDTLLQALRWGRLSILPEPGEGADSQRIEEDLASLKRQFEIQKPTLSEPDRRALSILIQYREESLRHAGASKGAGEGKDGELPSGSSQR